MKHRPSFLKFLFLKKGKECYCKNCGTLLQLNEKQIKTHFFTIPAIFTFVATTIISLYISFGRSSCDGKTIFLIRCGMIALAMVVLYILISLVEYLCIRFESVEN